MVLECNWNMVTETKYTIGKDAFMGALYDGYV